MKKLFIITVIAAFFAACSNPPAKSESAESVAKLKNWVDSIGKMVSTATTFDSAQWANWSAEFDNAANGINAADLDEASKTALEGARTAWAGFGDSYSAGLKAAKEAAMKAMQDTGAVSTDPTMMDKGKEMVKDGKEMVKDGKEMKKDGKEMMKDGKK